MNPFKRTINNGFGDSKSSLPRAGLLLYLGRPNLEAADVHIGDDTEIGDDTIIRWMFLLPADADIRAATGWVSGVGNIFYDAAGDPVAVFASEIAAWASINQWNVLFHLVSADTETGRLAIYDPYTASLATISKAYKALRETQDGTVIAHTNPLTDAIGANTRTLYGLQYLHLSGATDFSNASITGTEIVTSQPLGTAAITVAAGKLTIGAGDLWSFALSNGSTYEFGTILTATTGVVFDTSGNGRHLLFTVADTSVVCISGREKGSNYLDEYGYNEKVLGPELINNGFFNGTFASGVAPGWTNSGAVATEQTGVTGSGQGVANGSPSLIVEQSIDYTSGKTYELSLSGKRVSGAGYGYARILSAIIGTSTDVLSFTTDSFVRKTYTFKAIATAASPFRLWASSSTAFVFDDVSIREVISPLCPARSALDGYDVLGNPITRSILRDINLLTFTDLHYQIPQHIDRMDTLRSIVGKGTAIDADGFFSLGDIVEDSSDRTESQQQIADLAAVLPSGKSYFVLGNHDVTGTSIPSYLSDAAQFYPGGKNYYKDYGSWRVVVIDNITGPAWSADATTLTYLRAQLENARIAQKKVAVFCHAPIAQTWPGNPARFANVPVYGAGTLTPSGVSGSVSISASEDVFVSGDVGGRLAIKHIAGTDEFWGHCIISAFTDARHITVTVDQDFNSTNTSDAWMWIYGSVGQGLSNYAYNSKDIRAIIEAVPGVVEAVFSGHNHYNNLQVVNSIPYYILTTSGYDDSGSCSIITLCYDGAVRVTGFESQTSYNADGYIIANVPVGSGSAKQNITRISGTGTTLEDAGTYTLPDSHTFRTSVGWTWGVDHWAFTDVGVPKVITGATILANGNGPNIWANANQVTILA